MIIPRVPYYECLNIRKSRNSAVATHVNRRPNESLSLDSDVLLALLSREPHISAGTTTVRLRKGRHRISQPIALGTQVSSRPGSSFPSYKWLLSSIRAVEAPVCKARSMAETGMDLEGRTYSSAQEMWREETGEDMAEDVDQGAKKKEWYSKGVQYWAVSDI